MRYYYVGVCSELGKVVSDEDAFDYAMEQCHVKEDGTADIECKMAMEEWYFSGNWIKERGEMESNVWN